MNLFNAHIQPDTLYTCTSEWINEMGYRWKTGEQVLAIAAKDNSVLVRAKNDAQCFEINLDKFNSHFSLK